MRFTLKFNYFLFILILLISSNGSAQEKNAMILKEDSTIQEINKFVKEILASGSKFTQTLNYTNGDSKKSSKTDVSYTIKLIKFNKCKLSVSSERRSDNRVFDLFESAEIDLSKLKPAKFKILDVGNFMTAILATEGSRDIAINQTINNESSQFIPPQQGIKSDVREFRQLTDQYPFSIGKNDGAIKIFSALEQAVTLCQK